MTKVWWLGLFCVATTTLLSGCTSWAVAFRADEAFDLSLDDEGITALTIDWTNGTITAGVDENATEITATGTMFVNAETQEAADDSVEHITIELSVSESTAARAVLRCSAPRAGTRVYGADVEVTLPVGMTLRIESANGDIRVTRNEGDTTINLANGGVTADEVQGDLTVNLANGNVQVSNLQGSAEVEVANGGIDLEGGGGNVRADVANGNVDLRVRPAENATVQANTTTGSISIFVPADFAAALDLTSGFAGNVDADLSAFTVMSLETQRTQVTATLNGGGGQITAATTVGTVSFASLD